MNEIASFKTLVGTLYKKVNKASVYGKLNVKYLYLLNLVNELLFECPTCYNEDTKNKLKEIAIKLQNLDPEICIYREQKSLYTNIVGCKDCNPNNSPLQVINSKPIVTSPEPEEPVIEPPTICDNLIYSSVNGVKILYNDFIKCFVDSTGGSPKYLQITTLPEFGVLSYNGQVIEPFTNIVIDNNILISYIPFEPSKDSFNFQISGNNNDTIFSTPKTITIIPR